MATGSGIVKFEQGFWFRYSGYNMAMAYNV